MTTKELIKIGKSLGLEHYNETDKFVCFKGINGAAKVFYTSSNKASIMLDFAEHLKMIGRDSLRMELNSLLSITSHQ
jgi:hypothetical protein